jgi:hypothetical protein
MWIWMRTLRSALRSVSAGFEDIRRSHPVRIEVLILLHFPISSHPASAQITSTGGQISLRLLAEQGRSGRFSKRKVIYAETDEDASSSDKDSGSDQAGQKKKRRRAGKADDDDFEMDLGDAPQKGGKKAVSGESEDEFEMDDFDFGDEELGEFCCRDLYTLRGTRN